MDALNLLDNVSRRDLEDQMRRVFRNNLAKKRLYFARRIADLAIGDWAEMERTVTDLDILLFAAVSYDNQPLHLEEAYAAQTRFGRCVAHGMLIASFISALLGNKLPGPGTILVSQINVFLKPVFVGDRISSFVEVVRIDESRKRVTLLGWCKNQDGENVLNSKVLVVPPDKVILCARHTPA